ncbi:MAG: DNA polymerase Y family protein [Phycisphaerae bacterium]
MESLAIRAGDLSPIVHLEDAHTLLIDVTGCERLFGGEENLLSTAIRTVHAQGFSVRAAIADTPGAAWAIAHAHPDDRVIAPPGKSAVWIMPLPVWSLRIAESTASALASVGAYTVQTLLHLPRASLAMRFGAALLTRIDQATGDLPEWLTAYRPPRAVVGACDLGEPTLRLDRLTSAANHALGVFCEKLRQHACGACHILVTLRCAPTGTTEGLQAHTVTRQIDLARPTRSTKHLELLLSVLLERVRLPTPALSVTIWTRETHALHDWQDELFATDTRHRRDIAAFIDRLTVRLGSATVVRAELLSDHQPEKAFRYITLSEPQLVACAASRTSAPPEPGAPRGPKPAAQGERAARVPRRPLRLMPRPMEVGVTALAPQGFPIALRFDGRQHDIIDAAGPERIETGWWRGPHTRRDYYRLLTHTGRRLWLFRNRQTNRWFLHGWFD